MTFLSNPATRPKNFTLEIKTFSILVTLKSRVTILQPLTKMKTDLIYSPTLNLKTGHKYPRIIILKIHEFLIYCGW